MQVASHRRHADGHDSTRKPNKGEQRVNKIVQGVNKRVHKETTTGNKIITSVNKIVHMAQMGNIKVLRFNKILSMVQRVKKRVHGGGQRVNKEYMGTRGVIKE